MERPSWLSGWLFLLCASGVIVPAGHAQPPRPQHRFMAWQAPESPRQNCYAILGEVSRPGVYAASGREVTLQELIAQAGGLTSRASSSLRLIRQSRAAQTLLFSEGGHDPLQPNDIVIVDSQPDLRQETPSRVWLCFTGILERPIVVPVHPDNARLATIVKMLDQSPELVSTIRLIVPPRIPWPPSHDAPLATGTVLQFDRKLIVNHTLPSFPETLPLEEPPVSGTAQAEPFQPASRNSEPLSSQRVEAIPVPFPSIRDEAQASPTSLPIPGHPWGAEPTIPKPAEHAPGSSPGRSTLPSPSANDKDIVPIDPRWITDPKTEILPAPAPPEEPTEEEPQGLKPAATGPLSWWQMLGISGTVVGLIGIAIATRKYLDRQDAPRSRTTAFSTSHGPSRTTSDTAAHKPVEKSDSLSPDKPRPAEQDELTTLLKYKDAIVTEPVTFPQGFLLQRAPTARERYRVDRQADSQIGPHYRATPAPPRPALAVDPAEQRVPSPHFSPQAPTHSTARSSRSVVDRALAQLQEGPRS